MKHQANFNKAPFLAHMSFGLIVLLGLLLVLNPSRAQAGNSVAAVFNTFENEVAGGLAVNSTSGEVYAVDASANRIQRFAADGTFLGTFGGPGSANGQFDFDGTPGTTGVLTGIAVDQSDGSVYVVDVGNSRVQKFTAAGVFISAFGSQGSGNGQFEFNGGSQLLRAGVAVSPTAPHDVYVTDPGNGRVQRFTSSGAYVSQFGSPGRDPGQLNRPFRIAVASDGSAYVLDEGPASEGRVQRFSSTGAFEKVIDTSLSPYLYELAADPTDGHFYVGGYTAGFSDQNVFEFTGTGSLVDTHGVGLASGGGFGIGTGLAINSSNGDIYLADGFERHIFILTAAGAAPPTATIAPVTDIAAHSATFNGSVNPSGGLATGYHFEYSRDGNNWVSVPAQDIDVGSGTSDVLASLPATGLLANTFYRVRLIAKKRFSPAVTSAETTFTTGVAPPAVQTLRPASRTATTARLGGIVNAEGSPTSYYVEYSTDPSFATTQSAPAGKDADAGTSAEAVSVSQLVTGLTPGATYHYRLVADNGVGGGPVVGNARSFTTRSAIPYLPDGRGYELVSPPDKEGGEAGNLTTVRVDNSRASASGDAIVYMSFAPFANQPSAGLYNYYRSAHGSGGWSTRGVTPPVDPTLIPNLTLPFEAFSEDLTKGVMHTFKALNPDDPDLTWNSYVWDFPAGSYELLTRQEAGPIPPITDVKLAKFRAADPTLEHVAFVYRDRLTSDAPSGSTNLYEWSDGVLRNVAYFPDPDGPGPLVEQPMPNGGFIGSEIGYAGQNAVTSTGEGSRIYFESGGTAEVYLRERGESTIHVSASQRSAPDPQGPAGKSFELASDDGSIAFLTSSEKLTDGATAGGIAGGANRSDLYRYEVESGQLADLTTQDPGGAGVLGTLGASDAGDIVYFAATGSLDDGAESGAPNLYLWREGEGIHYIATLDPDAALPNATVDSRVWTDNRVAGAHGRESRVTADGRFLAFRSVRQLTSYDNAGKTQIYRYDSATDELACVSCNLRSGSSTTSVSLQQGGSATGTYEDPMWLTRHLASNGQVYFESPEALVPRDTNGKVDVYQWDEGDIRLLSTGQSERDSKFLDASVSGDDVFIVTAQRLSSFDRDDGLDVYDVRVGGGDPPAPLPPPDCEGDSCQGLPLAPNDPTPGSSSFSGPGSSRDRSSGALRCKRSHVKRRGRCIKRSPRGKRAAGRNHGGAK